MRHQTLIYLDHNASTPCRAEVAEAMTPCWQGVFGNPSSQHRFGQEAARLLERARRQVAGALGAEVYAEDIVFVSGGTEANALALLGALGGRRRGIHVLVSPMEHDSMRLLVERLALEGVDVEWLRVGGDGVVDIEEMKRQLRPATALVAVMLASHETGVIEPVAEMGAILGERGIRFHVDCVQAMGKIPVFLAQLGCTSASFSGHKIGAPKGIGALWRDRRYPLQSLWPGHQESSLRPGTPNVAAALGLGVAMALAAREQAEFEEYTKGLRDYFEREILRRCARVRINSRGAGRTSSTSHVSFEDIDGAAVVIALDLEGIACSTGSACASGTMAPSPALRAMGLEKPWLHGSVRFSFGRDIPQAHLDRALESIIRIVGRLRAASQQGVFLSI
ncbi:MAG: cysteine desulfurase [Elusimicrobia bacterium]|nr:cysteine desulfurase [Elusimicrobiota bacterium]